MQAKGIFLISGGMTMVVLNYMDLYKGMYSMVGNDIRILHYNTEGHFTYGVTKKLTNVYYDCDYIYLDFDDSSLSFPLNPGDCQFVGFDAHYTIYYCGVSSEFHFNQTTEVLT
jgi:hypothetical protein